MAITFNFTTAQIAAAITIGYLPIEVSSGVAASGGVNSAADLAHKLRVGGLPGTFKGVISFACLSSVDPMSLAPVANDLRAAGWNAARYEAVYSVSGKVHQGPAASAALRSLGARAFTGDGSILGGGAPSGGPSQGVYAHERVHQL
jgi:hypothetical protein